ncbi:hypothetical protein [Piscinibacter koreensis]|uniref:Uncharacterized protein n=1 Tax=Piscinibacter koreensis TaxID=2742824 RepID=A0A7Y6TXE3_9BURK|nr:hypothetical protein [Schlegelella koreensis]NUZ07068.1 hypothetical protein [Schlegelella koreensis]
MVVAFALVGPFAGGPQWLLFNKYVGYLIEHAFRSSLLPVWLGLFAAGAVMGA